MPFAHVGNIALALPHTAALFSAGFPLSVIGLAVVPLETASAVALSLGEIAEVGRTVGVAFVAEALFLAVYEVALKYFSVVVKDDSFAIEKIVF